MQFAIHKQLNNKKSTNQVPSKGRITKSFCNTFNIIRMHFYPIEMVTRREFAILVTLLVILFLINVARLPNPTLFVTNLACIMFLLGFAVYVAIRPELTDNPRS